MKFTDCKKLYGKTLGKLRINRCGYDESLLFSPDFYQSGKKINKFIQKGNDGI
jgi:hypothetical protein